MFPSRPRLVVYITLVLGGVVALTATTLQSATTSQTPKPAVTVEDGDNLQQILRKTLAASPKPTTKSDAAVAIWSQRADALFFLGQFSEAVEEYEQMVSIDPALKKSHWRLGIAYFFNEQPTKAVEIFEGYHSFDNVDRENGIWRYLSQYKATSAATAKKELLRYEKDDREPFPAVYKLFEGQLTEQEVIETIPGDLSASETDSRTFYIQLYCGMFNVVKDQKKTAISHLEKAVACKWPRTAGYGPHYMWQVARVQLVQLRNSSKALGVKER